MDSTRLLFLVMMIMAATITIFGTQIDGELHPYTKGDKQVDVHAAETETSVRVTSRFLAGNVRAVLTCDKYPRVCTVTGSPGPDCCFKQCVNVSIDKLNCGKCGKKCKYGEICCQGRCVNPSIDEKNCGSCYHRCKKGSQCVQGMCSYAN